jgi:hypothetical protein
MTFKDLMIWILALVNLGGFFITHAGINLFAFLLLMLLIIAQDQLTGDE